MPQLLSMLLFLLKIVDFIMGKLSCCFINYAITKLLSLKSHMDWYYCDKVLPLVIWVYFWQFHLYLILRHCSNTTVCFWWWFWPIHQSFNILEWIFNEPIPIIEWHWIKNYNDADWCSHYFLVVTMLANIRL